MKFRRSFSVPALVGLLVFCLSGCTISSEKDPAFIKMKRKLTALEDEQKDTKRSIENLYFECDTLAQDLSSVKTAAKARGASPGAGRQLETAIKRIHELGEEVKRLDAALTSQKKKTETRLAALKRTGSSASSRRSGGSSAMTSSVSRKRPTSSTARASSSRSRTPTQPKGFYYKVRQGDTLQRVAKKHSVTSAQICRANRMPMSATLYSGQLIYIPRRS